MPHGSNGFNSNGTCMNVDNFIGGRASSRVLAPPGGKSSISFGAADDAAPQQQQRRAAPAPGADDDKENNVGAAMQYDPPTKKQLRPATTSATGTQNQGNMLGEKPSTRVRAPPGGASSIVF